MTGGHTIKHLIASYPTQNSLSLYIYIYIFFFLLDLSSITTYNINVPMKAARKNSTNMIRSLHKNKIKMNVGGAK